MMYHVKVSDSEVVPVTIEDFRVSAPMLGGGRSVATRGLRGVREVLKGAVRLPIAKLSEDDRGDVITIEAMGQK